MQTIRRVREGDPLPAGAVQIVGYEDSLTGRWYLVLVRVPDHPGLPAQTSNDLTRHGYPPAWPLHYVGLTPETTIVRGPQWFGPVSSTFGRVTTAGDWVPW